MKSAEELMRVTLRRGLSPIAKVSVSEWADRHRVISAGAAEPGRWRTSRVPYMKAVMDAFTEPGVERVVVKSAAQVGKSEVLLNVLGRFAHVDPATIMIIQPTLEMATDFSKSRLVPMLNDCRALKPLFFGERAAGKTRDANQTLLSKFFTGGRIVLAGANSPAGLASRPIRILLCDEVDRFPPSAGGSEGDPLSLAAKRTSTYFNRRIGVFSTPTVEGISRIDSEFELGTRERWEHQCPNCGEYHTVEYQQITPDNRWRCPDCGTDFDEITIKNSRQRYSAPLIGTKGVRSFFITGFYSPWVSWRTIMTEWRDAQGKPDMERVVYNTRFGMSYELRGAYSDTTELSDRLEKYGAEVPEGVLLLTAAVDVQANRLEYEVVGWGVDEECWGIVKGVVHGSPEDDDTWTRLDKILDREYQSKARAFKIVRTFVDSGFMTSLVYEYCRRRLRRGRLPIKGLGGFGRRLLHKTEVVKGVPLTSLGVNEGKQMVYNRLQIEKAGAQYFHFGADDKFLRRNYTEKYFKGLTAEHKVVHQTGGMLYEMWEPVSKGVRNEPLDLRVYNIAAMRSLGSVDWESLAVGKPEKRSERASKRRAARSGEIDIWSE